MAEQDTSSTPEPEVDEAPELDPIEEFREEIRLLPGQWYVVHSYAGYENRVKANIESRVASQHGEDYIFDVQVPVDEVIEIKNGQRKKVKRNRFPGYVLVRMDMTDHSWSLVRNTPAVTGFVGYSERTRFSSDTGQEHHRHLTPLSLDEVVRILAPRGVVEPTEAEESTVETTVDAVDFAVGDPVTVIDGPFEGWDANVSEINAEAGKVTCLVVMFGRETPVELSFNQITKN